MDCRTFQRNLEDYLEDGLDFAGRFGMERHAQQCLRCGKEMAGAQQLRQMARGLERVKAPPDFESSIIKEISARKSIGPLWFIRSFWIYGFEWPSWRNVILASSSLAILGFVIFYASHRAASVPAPAPSMAAGDPLKEAVEPPKEAINDTKTGPGVKVVQPSSAKREAAAETPEIAKAPEPSSPPSRQYLKDPDAADMEYVEYQVIGPDNRPLTFRLPRYRQNSEEYFIQNVSH